MDDTKVSEIYRDITVSAKLIDTLSQTVDMMTRFGLDAISVVDEKGEYVGMISMRRIRRSHLDPSSVRVRNLVQRVPEIQTSDSIGEAARMMIEHNLTHLPVYSGKQFKGIITHDYIINHVMQGPLGTLSIKDHMSKNPVVVEPFDSVAYVLNLFREYGISHVPVMDGHKVVGMVSFRDIMDIVYREKKRPTIGERIGEKINLAEIEVKGVMSFPVAKADVNDTLLTCLDRMKRKDVSCLVVTDNGYIAGIVTKLDLLEPIAQETLESRRITVQFSIKPSVEIGEMDRKMMIGQFSTFKKKYEETLGTGTLFVYMKTQGSATGNRMIVQCRLNLRTRLGQYHSSSEAWGPIDAFSIALDRLVRGILQDKEAKTKSPASQKYAVSFLDAEI